MIDDGKLLPVPHYIEVRAGGRLLFKFDPVRDVVEIRNRGEMVYVDLACLRANMIEITMEGGSNGQLS